MEFVNWDYEIPNIWKVIKFMFQTTNQLWMVAKCTWDSGKSINNGMFTTVFNWCRILLAHPRYDLGNFIGKTVRGNLQVFAMKQELDIY